MKTGPSVSQITLPRGRQIEIIPSGRLVRPMRTKIPVAPAIPIQISKPVGSIPKQASVAARLNKIPTISVDIPKNDTHRFGPFGDAEMANKRNNAYDVYSVVSKIPLSVSKL